MQEITIPTPEQGLGGLQESGGTIAVTPVQLYDQSGNAAQIPNGSLQVIVTGGTLNTMVSFSGSISTDIGNVKIIDANDNIAEIPAANSVKTAGNHVLLVQQIDEVGDTLRQNTQDAILNSQGTLATDASLRSMRDGVATVYNNQGTLATSAGISQLAASLTAILNYQGTQSTAAITSGITALENTATAILNEMGTLATSAGQVTANAFLLSIDTNQASQATSANQVTGNNALAAIANNVAAENASLTVIQNNLGTLAPATLQPTLTAILNNQGTQSTAALAVIMNNQGTLATSASQGNAALAVVMNNQGTLATAALQQTASATAAVVMNNQGTQATVAAQAAGNASLAALVNDMGTLATAAGQISMGASLTAILTAQGTQSTAALAVIVNNQGTLATSTLQGAGNASLAVIANDMGTLATAAGQTTGNMSLGVIANDMGTVATSANQVTQNAYLLTLATDSALAATAANQQALLNQQATVIRTYGSSGTIPSNVSSVIMGLDPSSVSTDAFGRLRVSNPDYRFDGQFTYNIPSDLWDSAFNSTGTVTYDSTNRMANVTCATNGTAVLQSHKFAPYTPGRSQLALLSFLLGSTPSFNTARRVGYFDGTNGIYLEQTPSGLNLTLASSTSNGNQVANQSAWNIDKLDGTGPSGIAFDPTKVQIMAISLQALYSGRVLIGFDINGILWPVHQFTHANKITSPYIASASLPIRYESRSTGTNTISMNGICGSIISEGGGALAAIPGRTFGTGSDSSISVTTRRPVLSIQANKTFNGISCTGVILPNTFSIVSVSTNVYVELVRNGVLTGASWSNVDANSIAQVDTSATGISGGSTVFSTVISAGGGGGGGIPGSIQFPISENLLNRLVIAYSQLLNTSDVLSIVVTSSSGSSAIISALVWKEIR